MFQLYRLGPVFILVIFNLIADLKHLLIFSLLFSV